MADELYEGAYADHWEADVILRDGRAAQAFALLVDSNRVGDCTAPKASFDEVHGPTFEARERRA